MSRVFKPKSENQSDFIRLMVENDIVFCVGPPGSGKTACTVGLAMQYFLEEKCDRIIIIRPSLTADEDFTGGLGFLPGDLKAKTDPHFRPIYDELLTYLDRRELDKYIREDLIEIATLDYMRGRTFHNAFVLLDEAQNCSYNGIKMIVTRLGKSSKMVISGDTNQYDRRGESGMSCWFDDLSPNINGIGRMQLEKCDIVRHPLISAILTATEEYERSLK